jgi:hypothetical protein
MGEVVIKIPSNKKRRYIVTDASRADALIDMLDRSAVRVKNDPAHLSRRQLEDLHDFEAAKRNLDEMRQTGVSFSVEDLRREFGVS